MGYSLCCLSVGVYLVQGRVMSLEGVILMVTACWLQCLGSHKSATPPNLLHKQSVCLPITLQRNMSFLPRQFEQKMCSSFQQTPHAFLCVSHRGTISVSMVALCIHCTLVGAHALSLLMLCCKDPAACTKRRFGLLHTLSNMHQALCSRHRCQLDRTPWSWTLARAVLSCRCLRCVHTTVPCQAGLASSTRARPWSWEWQRARWVQCCLPGVKS